MAEQVDMVSITFLGCNNAPKSNHRLIFDLKTIRPLVVIESRVVGNSPTASLNNSH